MNALIVDGKGLRVDLFMMMKTLRD